MVEHIKRRITYAFSVNRMNSKYGTGKQNSFFRFWTQIAAVFPLRQDDENDHQRKQRVDYMQYNVDGMEYSWI